MLQTVINLLCSADVVSIPKTGENFRLLYDTKGRFRLHSIKDEEAKVKAPVQLFRIRAVLALYASL